jgi:DNA-binding transcriptional ArsR family regulator
MARARIRSTADLQMAKAMAHPTRQEALRILNERVASPSDIAAEIGMPLGSVAYHIRQLLQLDCIEEVEVRPVRGALEHRYRAIRRAFLMPAEWEALPRTAREAFTGQWLTDAIGDVTASMAAEVFNDREDRHMSRTNLALDEQAWRELTAELLELLEGAIAKQAAAAVRLADGEAGGPPIRSVLTMLHFEAAPADAGPA